MKCVFISVVEKHVKISWKNIKISESIVLPHALRVC